MQGLVNFELKKITSNKVNIVLALIMTGLVLCSFVPDMIKYSTTTKEGIILKDRKAVQYDKSRIGNIFNSLVSDKKIKEDVFDLAEKTQETDEEFYDIKPHMTTKDYESYFKPREEYFDWLTYSYEGSTDKSYWNISDLLVNRSILPDFYRFRDQKVNRKIMGSKVIKDNPRDVSYWIEKKVETKGPYQYGFYSAWNSINDSLDMYVISLLIVIAISVSGVFARENESNMISILLSSRYGRNKLASAKIIASILYVLRLSLVTLTIIIVPNILFYGVGGWNLPVQLLNTTILYDWDFLELVLVRCAISIIVALSFASLSLLVSAMSKKTYIVDVIMLMIIIICFLLPDVRSRRFTQIAMLLPAQMNGVLYYSYISYNILGQIFNVYTVGFIVHCILAIVLFLSARGVFRRQEIK